MRARGKENMQVFTAEDAAEKFGVVRSSYEGVPLPKIKAYHVSLFTNHIANAKSRCLSREQ